MLVVNFIYGLSESPAASRIEMVLLWVEKFLVENVGRG
jgi:hypothetical protein